MIDCVSWGWQEKTGGLIIWYACVEQVEADDPPADTRRKGEDDPFFLELLARRGEVKIYSWTTATKK